jgi:hypothetical protein
VGRKVRYHQDRLCSGCTFSLHLCPKLSEGDSSLHHPPSLTYFLPRKACWLRVILPLRVGGVRSLCHLVWVQTLVTYLKFPARKFASTNQCTARHSWNSRFTPRNYSSFPICCNILLPSFVSAPDTCPMKRRETFWRHSV